MYASDLASASHQLPNKTINPNITPVAKPNARLRNSIILFFFDYLKTNYLINIIFIVCENDPAFNLQKYTPLDK